LKILTLFNQTKILGQTQQVYIQSNYYTSKYVDAFSKDRVALSNGRSGLYAIWQVVNAGDGFVYLQNARTNKYLEGFHLFCNEKKILLI
jgi:hypothetical protein